MTPADPSLWWQYAVIAVLVLASAWVVLAKQSPATARWLRVALALPLLREGRAPWLRAIGRRLAPSATAAGGCAGCNDCGPPKG